MMLKIIWYKLYMLCLLLFLTSCSNSKDIGENIIEGIEIQSKADLIMTLEEDQIISDMKDLEGSKEVKIEESDFVLNTKSNSFETYIQENEDFTGFITIDNTLINHPVVKGDDNKFYLKRNFNQQKDYYGSIFMDYRNFGSGFDKNLIIYGHNMKDDAMFGQLRYYMDESYAKDNPIITFQDLYTSRKYQVFSGYFAQSDASLITTSFSDTSFLDYLQTIQNLSQYDLKVNINENDHIITLVTCSYDVDDGRYFVHGVEIID